MIVYIVLFSIINLMGFFIFGKGVSMRRNRLFLFASFIPIFLVQALRSYNVGSDSLTYYFAFISINSNSTGYIVDTWEPLYIVLNKLIGAFTNNPQWLFVVSSLLIDIGVIIFIFNNLEDGKSAFWPVFFWFVCTCFFNSMNTLRQQIALSIVVNIYTILRKERTKRAYIASASLLVVGMLFHTMSIVATLYMVPFLFYWDKKQDLLFASLLAAALVVLSSTLVSYALIVFPKYAKYVDTFYFDEAGMSLYNLAMIMVNVIFLIEVFVTSDYNAYSRNIVFPLSFFAIMSITIYIVKAKIFIVGRLVYYFDFFEILFFPCMINRIEQRQVIYFFTLLAGWALFLYMLYSGQATRGCIPYMFFWQ